METDARFYREMTGRNDMIGKEKKTSLVAPYPDALSDAVDTTDCSLVHQNLLCRF